MIVSYHRKKPVVIGAVQWNGTAGQAEEIVAWINANGGDAQFISFDLTHSINIKTLEGEMQALEGWWVIQGVEGEFYPCKDSVFQESYEPA